MFSLNLKYTGFPPKKRDYNNAVKQTLAATAKNWHQQYYEKHFTAAGAAEYGYTKRKGEAMPRGSSKFRSSYTGKKLKRFGHTDPLKFTGTGFRLGKVAIIRSTYRWGKAVLPSVFNFKHPKSQINMREELTRVSTREQDHLRQLADRDFGRFIPEK